MPMKLTETTFSNGYIRMRFQDADLEPSEWLEFEVPTAGLMLDEHNPLRDPETRHLATSQRAALHFVRDAISDEIQRLAALLR